MVTSFTRIVIRAFAAPGTAIGTQTAPPNTVMTGLALFLTAFIMAPTFRLRYEAANPPIDRRRDPRAGSLRARERAIPARFMLQHVRAT